MAMKIRFISVIAVSALVGVTALPFATAATPTVSATVKAQLIYLIQEEKLARDSYASIAKFNTSNKFKNITPSEQTHMDQLKVIFKTYGIKDPTTNLKAGVFVDKKLTALYKTLMDKAVLSSADAIAVGVLIEQTDIKDINTLSKSVTQADIKLVLANLLQGSEKHLAAFSR
jgi:hypothetical protein